MTFASPVAGLLSVLVVCALGANVSAAANAGTPASGTPAPCTGRWEVVSSPSPMSTLNRLTGVAAISANDIWAVGYGSDGSGHRTLTEHWDGSSWTVVPSPNRGTGDNVLNGVAPLADGRAVAVGYSADAFQTEFRTLVEVWTGTAWRIVPSPTIGSFSILTAVEAISDRDVWAVGYHDSPEGYRTLTLHWNGSSWTVVPSPTVGFFDTLRGVSAVGSADVWAVGYDEDSLRTRAMHWDGAEWTLVPTRNPSLDSNFLNGVAAVSATDVWAVGYYLRAFVRNETLVERWDGSEWHVVASPNPGSNGNALNAVAAHGASNVWAVGWFSTSGALRTLALRWIGSRWVHTSTPNVGTGNNTLTSVAPVSLGNVWAVGSSFDGSGDRTLILNLCR